MQQQINFYQSEFRSRRELFTARTIAQATAAVFVAMLVAYLFAEQQVPLLEQQQISAGKQEAAALRRLDALQPVIAAIGGGKSWRERFEEQQNLLEEKELVLSLLQGTSFGDAHGFARHLRSLARVDIDGIWLTHIRLSALGDDTQLEGHAVRAKLVPAYLQFLATEAPFSSQRFYHFRIEGEEEGNDGRVSFLVTSNPDFVAQPVAAR